MTKNQQLKTIKGFTLIEILIYVSIFAVVGGALTGILLNATRVGERESASAEVTSQLNFVMQTIQRLVRESSNIEIEAGTSTSTLKLRMMDSAKDPTIISLSGNSITIKEGTNATTTLTNDKVVVNTLDFKKFTQYPGHDTVSIDLTMTYNTQSATGQVQRTLNSAIARVSAATFDSDVVPGSSYTYSLGQAGAPWQNIYMKDGSEASPSYTFANNTGLGLFRAGTNILGFTTAGSERMRIDASGNVGIGTTTPSQKLHIVSTSDKGLIVEDSNTIGSSIQLKATATGGRQYGIYSTADGTGFGGKLLIYDETAAGTAFRFIIDSTGNVGIGTTGPNTALDINGALSVRGMSAPAVSPSGQGRIYFDSTANKFKVSENSGAYSDLGGGTAGVPNGTIIFYNGGTCPAGWSEVTDARGRYIVGLPSGGTLAGIPTGTTALSNLENRPVGQHNHASLTPPGFTIDVAGSGLGRYSSSPATTDATTANAGTVAGTNAPYIQYLVCQYVGTGGSTAGTTVPGHKYGLAVTYSNTNVVNVTVTALEVGGLLISSINVSPSLAASGANGLDTGTEAANTWYAVYVITNDAGTSVAGLYSTNFTAPTLPSGYTKSRRVGSVRNNASSNIIKFYWPAGGNLVLYDAEILLANNMTAASWTDVDCAAVMPPSSRTLWASARNQVANATFNWRRNGSSDGTGQLMVYGGPAYLVNNLFITVDDSRIFEYISYSSSGYGGAVYADGYEENI